LTFVRTHGILFKFALDIGGLYGSDTNAMKVAAHEWRGLNCFHCANINEITVYFDITFLLFFPFFIHILIFFPCFIIFLVIFSLFYSYSLLLMNGEDWIVFIVLILMKLLYILTHFIVIFFFSFFLFILS
jgi:hypothetical protein